MTHPPKLDLDALERKALAATPGRWITSEDWEGRRTGVIVDQPMHYPIVCHYLPYEDSGATTYDAEFIAAANPETVLQLIQLARSEAVLRAKLEEMIEAMDRVSDWLNLDEGVEIRPGIWKQPYHLVHESREALAALPKQEG